MAQWVKVLASNPNNLGLRARNHTAEKESRFPNVILTLTGVHTE